MSNNALSTLQSILLESPSEIIHDATIQRLKISINQKASSSINRKSFLQALQVDLITPEDVIIDPFSVCKSFTRSIPRCNSIVPFTMKFILMNP